MHSFIAVAGGASIAWPYTLYPAALFLRVSPRLADSPPAFHADNRRASRRRTRHLCRPPAFPPPSRDALYESPGFTAPREGRNCSSPRCQERTASPEVRPNRGVGVPSRTRGPLRPGAPWVKARATSPPLGSGDWRPSGLSMATLALRRRPQRPQRPYGPRSATALVPPPGGNPPPVPPPRCIRLRVSLGARGCLRRPRVPEDGVGCGGDRSRPPREARVPLRGRRRSMHGLRAVLERAGGAGEGRREGRQGCRRR